MTPDIKGTLFEKLFGGNAKHVDSLPHGDPLKEQGQSVGDMYTSSVIALKNPMIFPNKRLNELGRLVWNLVHYRITHTIIHPGVKAMHFYGEAKGGPLAMQLFGHDGNNRVGNGLHGKFTAFFFPENWVQMVDDDGVMQGGAVVFCGSQARDFYNENIDNPVVTPGFQGRSEVLERARAYEAEYLLVCKELSWKVGGDWHPNDYQQSILDEFPKGLASLAEGRWYESKPFKIPD